MFPKEMGLNIALAGLSFVGFLLAFVQPVVTSLVAPPSVRHAFGLALSGPLAFLAVVWIGWSLPYSSRTLGQHTVGIVFGILFVATVAWAVPTTWLGAQIRQERRPPTES